MARLSITRLEELKRRALERAPSAKSEAWQYLELEEGKPLTDEQQAILKHNLESKGNGAGYRYLLLAKQVYPSTAPEDLNEALDELNELGILDQVQLFDYEREN
jgi:hypothetical protein